MFTHCSLFVPIHDTKHVLDWFFGNYSMDSLDIPTMAFFLSTQIDVFQILIRFNIDSMISFNTCSNVLIWNLANISVISWSFSKIFLLKISLFSTYKMPPHLLSNLLKALSNLSPNIQKIGILHTGCLPHRVFICK